MVFYLILGTLMVWLGGRVRKRKWFEHFTGLISKISKQKKEAEILVYKSTYASEESRLLTTITTVSLVTRDLVAIILNHLEGFLNTS